MNCCRIRSEPNPADRTVPSICRVCGERAKKVERLTIGHIIKADHSGAIRDTQYYFCETPTCNTVYFSNDTEQYFTKEDVRVRVGLKETQDPVQVCYCFDFTEQMIRDEVLTNGRTSIPDMIATEIKAGHCACEVKNPSGRCCLGQVNKIIKRMQAQLVGRHSLNCHLSRGPGSSRN